MAFDKTNLDSYNDVASRMAEFFTKHPEGSLQPADPAQPFDIKVIGDRAFVVYTAAAYRTPTDARPGIGIAWEPFPGRTPYTRDSEVMNAETSAWGRAILAVGAADTRKGVASADEVRNRQAERDADWDRATTGRPTQPTRTELVDGGHRAISTARDTATLAQLRDRVDAMAMANSITTDDAAELHAAINGREAELVAQTSGDATIGLGGMAVPATTQGGGPIQDVQRRKLFGLFNQLGMTDRAKQMDLIRRVLGVDIQSRNDLTAGHAAKVIGVLEAQIQQGAGKANGHQPEVVAA